MASASRPAAAPITGSLLLWPLVLLTLAFLMGGGSRADISSLPLLRALFCGAFVFALYFHGRSLWQHHRSIAVLGIAMVALPLLQLVPLPPDIWTALPGRGVVAEVFAKGGVALPWMPLSMTPVATVNALFAVVVPVTMALLAFRLNGEQQLLMVRAVLIIGAVSGIMGLLQAIGSSSSGLYLYRITNNGLAVGLFANRNHQAIFLCCLLPVLAAYVTMVSGNSERVRIQKIVALAAGLFLIPLLLVTGSRTGLLLAVPALVMAWWIYQPPRVFGRRIELSSTGRLSMVIYGVLLAGIIGLLVFASVRAPAVQRLLEEDAVGDLRWQALPTIIKAAMDHFPFGTGLGSFAEIYKMYEPSRLLSDRYFNQAHNDYAELLLTGGLPGVLIILFALVLLVAGVRRAISPPAEIRDSRAELTITRTGAAILVLLAIASIGDYPLRTPSLAALAAVAVAWLFDGPRRMSQR